MALSEEFPSSVRYLSAPTPPFLTHPRHPYSISPPPSPLPAVPSFIILNVVSLPNSLRSKLSASKDVCSLPAGIPPSMSRSGRGGSMISERGTTPGRPVSCFCQSRNCRNRKEAAGQGSFRRTPSPARTVMPHTPSPSPARLPTPLCMTFPSRSLCWHPQWQGGISPSNPKHAPAPPPAGPPGLVSASPSLKRRRLLPLRPLSRSSGR